MEVSPMLSSAQSHHTPAAIISVAMFSLPVRSLWFLLLACTLVSELVPLSLEFEARFSTLTFHAYEAAKLVMFFGFGLLTPIAWYRYKSLGMGVLFAIMTTAIVEVGQAFITGHRFSTIELVVKLVLLFSGFAAALNIRKYQEFTVGPLCVRFTSRYWQSLS
jgi:hypothetical protein